MSNETFTEAIVEQTDDGTKQAPQKRRHNVGKVTKFLCDQCDCQFRVKYDGNEGTMYACDQCDYHAKRKDHLNLHIKSKHEGVKYPCDHCDFQSTQKSHLNSHIRN